jgi:hypothetical protein
MPQDRTGEIPVTLHDWLAFVATAAILAVITGRTVLFVISYGLGLARGLADRDRRGAR